MLAVGIRSLIVIAVVSVCMILAYWWNYQLAPMLYPFMVNTAIAITFAMTLIYPPSMIERFARLQEPDLDSFGVYYTRNVTIIWVVFCVVNAGISLVTVIIGDLKLWTLYNGCISYILIGLLMLGEYVVRPYFRTKNERQRAAT